MNLFRKLWQTLFRRDDVTVPDNYSTAGTGGVREYSDTAQRIKTIYGDEKFDLQLLYEKWAVRESWLLRDQALPLLLGLDPESAWLQNDMELSKKIEDMWEHAINCVEQGVLEVNNKKADKSKWEINPFEAYRWAKIGRFPVPEELCTLMDFISGTVSKKVAQTGYSADNSDNRIQSGRFDQAREQVLGMALAILAAYPDACRNSRGTIGTDKIISIINQKSSFWLGDNKLEISPVVMRDILNRWLKTLPNQET